MRILDHEVMAIAAGRSTLVSVFLGEGDFSNGVPIGYWVMMSFERGRWVATGPHAHKMDLGAWQEYLKGPQVAEPRVVG